MELHVALPCVEDDFDAPSQTIESKQAIEGGACVLVTPERDPSWGNVAYLRTKTGLAFMAGIPAGMRV